MPTINFCPWLLELTEPLSQFVPLFSCQSPSENHGLIILKLLLVAFQLPAALALYWAAQMPSQLTGDVVTHRARQQFPSSSRKWQGKAVQSSHSPALSNFPKKYSVPSCCSLPVTLHSFPPIRGPPLLEPSSPFEQFLLSLLQASQLFTIKRAS